MIRISLIEPSGLWRSALSAFISKEPDIEVSSEFALVSEAIQQVACVQKTEVGVIGIDAKSEHSNLAAVRELKEVAPSCHFLALVDEVMAGSISPALSYVQGFVSRNIQALSLVTSIRRVARKEQVIEPASLAVAAVCAPPNPLTLRERETLQAVMSGADISQVAARLGLASGTVRNYISSIKEKTGARSRMEAIRIVRDKGWL